MDLNGSAVQIHTIFIYLKGIGACLINAYMLASKRSTSSRDASCVPTCCESSS
jgi:hypothetical protein